VTATAPLDPYLSYLMATEATDLHLSVGSAPRVRIDGQLLTIPDAPICTAEFLDSVTDGLLSSTDRARLDTERQVDMSFAWQSAEHSARFRANAFFQSDRPALALRLIPSEIPTPESIGLPESTAALVNRPYGLVLMTGPTGSGKSTTLAAMIGWINQHRPVHVLTIEDPIEYVHSSATALVNQREVGSDCTSFAEALRSALREDPDVILVGEMRDLETIRLALTLAETGHLVFGTVHTNDAAQTVDRIVDAYPADQQPQIRTQFSMTLAAVISQRLIPRIGRGRVAAYEVMMGTTAITNLIREGQTRQIRNAIATGSKDGMMLLEHSLNQLVKAGVVTYDAAVANSVYSDEIELPPGAVLDPVTGRATQPGQSAGAAPHPTAPGSQPLGTDPLTGQPLGGTGN